jgi:hypothetical protein
MFNVSINPVNYKMEICLCKESTVARVKQLIASNVRPVLLYFEEGANEMP